MDKTEIIERIHEISHMLKPSDDKNTWGFSWAEKNQLLKEKRILINRLKSMSLKKWGWKPLVYTSPFENL